MRSLEYFAGFFDGEGCIQGSSKDHSVRINVTNTHHAILVEFRDRFGGAVYYNNHTSRPNRKPAFRWNLERRSDVISFLLKMEPLLVVKKRQANIALDILSIKIGISRSNITRLMYGLTADKNIGNRFGITH